MLRLTLFIMAMALCATNISAQNKDDARYRKISERIRKDVWAWDRPEFKQTDIPEKYKNVSRVTLARHTELVADSKTKLVYYGFGFGTSKEQNITEIVREMVKVNDKSAVDEFSELSFTRFERRSGFVGNSKSITYVGVRVIKADKSIKEVDADDMVLTKDARSEKKAKLAISNLEPGDIIDYFIATEQQMSDNYSDKPYNLFLFDDAPVLHFSFHGQLGKKYVVDYRSYNGAPDLDVTKNDDKEVIIDVVKKDMAPIESTLWVAPALQLPLIRMSISLGLRGPMGKFMGAKKPGEVTRNVDAEKIVKSLAETYSQRFYSNYFMKAGRLQWEQIIKDAKRRAKAMNINYKKMTDEDKALLLFYTTRFNKMLGFKLYRMQESIQAGDYLYDGLAFPLNCILKLADVDAGIVTAAPRTGFRMQEIMLESDLHSAAFLEESKKILFLKTIYDHPFEIPEGMDGVSDTRTIRFKNKTMVLSGSAMNKFAHVDQGFAIPVVKAPANSHLDELTISVNPDDTRLQVKRRAIAKGQYKYDLQRRLILYEDYYESERKSMGEKLSLLEELRNNKKTRKHVEEVKSAFAEARKKQKDAFIDQANAWFEQDVTELRNYKVENMGVRHTHPDLIYSSEFLLDGLLKRAGNNLILEIGKIQGEPLSVRDQQRKRVQDIHMAYPRSIGYDIRIKIPDGYSVEGLDALKTAVENETGYFKTDASVNGQVITITIKKSYLHSFEPAANWEKMLAFIDASNEFTNAKILFRKN